MSSSALLSFRFPLSLPPTTEFLPAKKKRARENGGEEKTWKRSGEDSLKRARTVARESTLDIITNAILTIVMIKEESRRRPYARSYGVKKRLPTIILRGYRPSRLQARSLHGRYTNCRDSTWISSQRARARADQSAAGAQLPRGGKKPESGRARVSHGIRLLAPLCANYCFRGYFRRVIYPWISMIVSCMV